MNGYVAAGARRQSESFRYEPPRMPRARVPASSPTRRPRISLVRAQAAPSQGIAYSFGVGSGHR